jgi:peptidoglycan/LPS O-acetylase OafA/YrhL
VNTERRIPELDGLRGLAIALVILWHYCAFVAPGHNNPYLALLFSLTWSGVDLFFVLSGFLIGGILIDHAGTRQDFHTFYMRRIYRIFPLYFLWLALFYLARFTTVSLMESPVWQKLFGNPLPFLSYLTFTQNFVIAATSQYGAGALSPTWSLAVEEQFYLCLPLLVWFTPRRFLPRLLITLILAAMLLRGLFWYYTPNLILAPFVLMPARMDSLLLGVLGAWFVRQPHSARYLTEVPKPFYNLAIALIIPIILLFTLVTGATAVLGYTFLALFYLALLFIAISEKRGPLTLILRNRAMRFLGQLAYGLYLFHKPINSVLHGLLLGQTPRFLTPAEMAVTFLSLLASIALAQLSWRYFEQPLLARGRQYKYQPMPELLPEPAASHSLPATQARNLSASGVPGAPPTH